MSHPVDHPGIETDAEPEVATDALIAALSSAAEPAPRLGRPWWRALGWSLLAVMILAVLAAWHGIRGDMHDQMDDPRFMMGVGSAILTGILAATAAFVLVLPDRSPWWVLLPLPALGLWVSTISYGCAAAWVGLGDGGIDVAEEIRCFGTLLLGSVPLTIALFVMLRRGAAAHPSLVVICGGLAVAALTAVAVNTIHQIEASAMILVWNFGSAAAVIAADALFGRRLLPTLGPDQVSRAIARSVGSSRR